MGGAEQMEIAPRTRVRYEYAERNSSMPQMWEGLGCGMQNLRPPKSESMWSVTPNPTPTHYRRRLYISGASE